MQECTYVPRLGSVAAETVASGIAARNVHQPFLRSRRAGSGVDCEHFFPVLQRELCLQLICNLASRSIGRRRHMRHGGDGIRHDGGCLAVPSLELIDERHLVLRERGRREGEDEG